MKAMHLQTCAEYCWPELELSFSFSHLAWTVQLDLSPYCRVADPRCSLQSLWIAWFDAGTLAVEARFDWTVLFSWPSSLWSSRSDSRYRGLSSASAHPATWRTRWAPLQFCLFSAIRDSCIWSIWTGHRRCHSCCTLAGPDWWSSERLRTASVELVSACRALYSRFFSHSRLAFCADQESFNY